MNRSRIFWRSFLSILIPSALVVTLLSVLPWWFFIRGEETALHERQTHKVLLASGFVARDFASVISDLRVLSNDQSLQDWVDGGESTDLRKFQRNVLALHRDKSEYDSIRLLDMKGMELVRVQNREGKSVAIPDRELQQKGDRDYFIETKYLIPRDFYISPMELNKEHGRVEIPYKPVIRIGTVLATAKGRKRAVLMINYLAENLIDDIVEVLDASEGRGIFLNRDGYWLHSHDGKDEWGFMLGKSRTFASVHPEAWRVMKDEDQGIVESGQETFTFYTVYPVEEAAGQIPGNVQARWADANPFAYRWKIISAMDESEFFLPFYRVGWIIYIVLLGGTSLFAFFLARGRTEKYIADQELRRSQRNLFQAQRIAGLGSWEWDISTGNITCSNEVYRIFGIPAQSQPTAVRLLRQSIHPEDRQMVDDMTQRAMTEHAPLEAEFRILRRGGQVRHIWALGEFPPREEAGRRRMIGTVLDITARKEAEMEIKSLNLELEARVNKRTRALADTNKNLTTVQSQLSAALNAISEGFMFFDSEDKLTLVNTRMWELHEGISDLIVTGARFEDIIRKAVARGYFPEAEGREDEYISERMAIHRNPQGVFERKLADGKWMEVEEHRTVGGGYVSTRRDITERKLSEQALRESEEQVRLLLESTSEAIYGLDTTGNCTFINPACLKMLAYEKPSDCLEKNMHHLIHHSRRDGSPYPEEDCLIFQGFRSGSQAHVDDEVLWRADGSSFDAEYWSHPIIKNGQAVGAVVTFIDITSRKKAEQELRQAQKMEVVGQLTGGVAHDFNNILQIITGYSHIARNRMADDDPGAEHLDKVLHAARRAADLTQQLLAFSRQQVHQPRPVDIAELITNLTKMLARVISENIEIAQELQQGLAPVFADPGMIEQVLLNLCINARDAMPDGGRIVIEAEKFVATSKFCEHHSWAKPGTYALISVSDTGCGMSSEVQEKIFEPFFTTKEVGKGTGLGLAMAYGTIQQHGGHIIVYSEEGRGATFRIYLPTTQDGSQAAAEETEETLPGGTETVLVAEDEAAVLDLVTDLLTEKGYTVITATNGNEALQMIAEHDGKLDLVILDMVMPQLGGRATYEKIKQINPALPVIFSTGYAANALDKSFLEENDLRLIRKPFAPDDLYRNVRAAIDA